MALKTNTKKAKQNIMDYIKAWDLDYLEERRAFEVEEGRPVYNLNNDANICAFIYQIFQEEKPGSDEYYKRRKMNVFEIFKDWAQGLPLGGLFCYYYNREARDDVAAILEETEEEKAKFTEEKATELLTYLIFREIEARRIKAEAPEVVKAEAEEPEASKALESINKTMQAGFNRIAAATTTTATTAEA